MSGNKITDQQVKRYMKFRQTENQAAAAAKAGISERSARRIDKHELHPKTEERSWRTRSDPLAEVWENIVVPMLQRDNEITPVGIFDHLCEFHSDLFTASSRRTLERRIGKWSYSCVAARPKMGLTPYVYRWRVIFRFYINHKIFKAGNGYQTHSANQEAGK